MCEVAAQLTVLVLVLELALALAPVLEQVLVEQVGHYELAPEPEALAQRRCLVQRVAYRPTLEEQGARRPVGPWAVERVPLQLPTEPGSPSNERVWRADLCPWDSRIPPCVRRTTLRGLQLPAPRVLTTLRMVSRIR